MYIYTFIIYGFFFFFLRREVLLYAYPERYLLAWTPFYNTIIIIIYVYETCPWSIILFGGLSNRFTRAPSTVPSWLPRTTRYRRRPADPKLETGFVRREYDHCDAVFTSVCYEIIIQHINTMRIKEDVVHTAVYQTHPDFETSESSPGVVRYDVHTAWGRPLFRFFSECGTEFWSAQFEREQRKEKHYALSILPSVFRFTLMGTTR